MYKRAKEDIYLEEEFSRNVNLISVFKPVKSGKNSAVVLRLPCPVSWEMSAAEASELGEILKAWGEQISRGPSIDNCETIKLQARVTAYLWWDEIVLEIGNNTFHLSGVRAKDIGEKLCLVAKEEKE